MYLTRKYIPKRFRTIS